MKTSSFSTANKYQQIQQSCRQIQMFLRCILSQILVWDQCTAERETRFWSDHSSKEYIPRTNRSQLVNQFTHLASE